MRAQERFDFFHVRKNAGFKLWIKIGDTDWGHGYSLLKLVKEGGDGCSRIEK